MLLLLLFRISATFSTKHMKNTHLNHNTVIADDLFVIQIMNTFSKVILCNHRALFSLLRMSSVFINSGIFTLVSRSQRILTIPVIDKHCAII